MPSPFPGMDPYLEGEMWQEFHETLASAMRAQLMPHLTPRYVALLAKRSVVDRPALGIVGVPPARVMYPDVHVVTAPAAFRQVSDPHTPICDLGRFHDLSRQSQSLFHQVTDSHHL